MNRYIMIDYTECAKSERKIHGITMYDEDHEQPLSVYGSYDNVEIAIGRNLPAIPGEDLKTSGLLDCEAGYFIDMSRYALDDEGYVRHTTYEENQRANWGLDDYELELRPFRPAIEMDLIICERNRCKILGKHHCFHHKDERLRDVEKAKSIKR